MKFSEIILKGLLMAVLVSNINAITIICSYGEFDWTAVGYRYNCFISSINDSNKNQVMGIHGEHVGWMNNWNVEGITLHNASPLKRLPRGIEDFFPNIMAILWNGGSLESISADDLKPFPNLAELNLEGNPLVSINENIFEHSNLIRSINFENIRLSHVSPEFISSLSLLENANFVRNECIRAPEKDFIPFLQNRLRSLCLPLVTSTETPTTVTTVTTLTPNVCPQECSERFAFLESLAEQQERRLYMLERQMRELMADPKTRHMK
jgi:hypothetical protein